MICVLSGGTGGAKFIQGLARVVPPEQITILGNTGDDLTWWGLHVSPDLDSVTYALSGLLSRERGWGVDGDTFECLATMRRLGAPAWFQLGDRDLALHLRRTELLAQGSTLTDATRDITQMLGMRSRLLPMSDDRVETRVLTGSGEISFQEYFVRDRYGVPALGVRIAGVDQARPAPGVLEAIRDAEAVLLAPSNPITSIGPILAVPGIRQALRETEAPVGAVSPIVGGVAVSGPAAGLMRAQGLPPGLAGLTAAYGDFLDLLIADVQDEVEVSRLPSALTVHCAQTVMKSEDDKAALAQTMLGQVRRLKTSLTAAGGAR